LKLDKFVGKEEQLKYCVVLRVFGVEQGKEGGVWLPGLASGVKK
jgi:hypothetical protein